MRIYIFNHIHVHKLTHTGIHLCMHVCIHIFMHTHTHTHTHAHAHGTQKPACALCVGWGGAKAALTAPSRSKCVAPAQVQDRGLRRAASGFRDQGLSHESRSSDTLPPLLSSNIVTIEKKHPILLIWKSTTKVTMGQEHVTKCVFANPGLSL